MTEQEYRNLCQKACDCLNSAFEADPAAMHSLTAFRFPCNQSLADHPSVVVDCLPVLKTGPYFAVGTVGVIVGMFREMGFPCTVASKWSDDTDEDGRPKFMGFVVVDLPEIQ